MLKAKVLVPAIAIALFSAACGQAAGPADVILGKWRGTDSPTSCPQTELTVTRDVFTSVQDGVAHQFRVLGIGLQANQPDEVNVTTGEENTFHIIDHNHIQLHTAFAQCSYTRE
jgi:hypothetical protein